ncbi:uncharacterized protein BDZ99DRAFT_526148 [Mytilinidion resinicola]|uniref:Uncharacterized protein n=1 Tax=Mytilinidion resinicola TaxID=574789 RepID=A0A6A6Y6G5_9PEZI|nr:uncharacterized protein BDZ99DRAFT_526148 [Mytilinidion resinicola]KAF2804113.1 hypothetical protein BDZ99DRAFT_526148 [Mytilinidion resinicola]
MIISLLHEDGDAGTARPASLARWRCLRTCALATGRAANECWRTRALSARRRPYQLTKLSSLSVVGVGGHIWLRMALSRPHPAQRYAKGAAQQQAGDAEDSRTQRFQRQQQTPHLPLLTNHADGRSRAKLAGWRVGLVCAAPLLSWRELLSSGGGTPDAATRSISRGPVTASRSVRRRQRAAGKASERPRFGLDVLYVLFLSPCRLARGRASREAVDGTSGAGRGGGAKRGAKELGLLEGD